MRAGQLDSENVYLSGAKNMGEALKQRQSKSGQGTHQMPHSQYYGSNGQNMGNQGAGSMSIAMRMKANRDALLPKADNQSEYGAYMQNKEYARAHAGPQSAKGSYQQSPSKYAEMIHPAQEHPSNRIMM